MITVVDYGMGNLGSILNLCRHLGLPTRIGSTPEQIAKAERLILPGVGAFSAGVKQLDQLGFREVLHARVIGAGVPLLGICLGMQLLTRGSEEGGANGLGWIAADTVRFQLSDAADAELRIPHMGWATVAPRDESRLFAQLRDEPRFYFVHSFHVVCDDVQDVAAQAHHGRSFVAAIERANLFGTQFHPEKSHQFGMQLIRNFARL
jgi:imidazole glycerol-phosphate synthase subunit HisH